MIFYNRILQWLIIIHISVDQVMLKCLDLSIGDFYYGLEQQIFFHDLCTITHTHKAPETKAGCLSVLPRGESQWGAAFSSCMLKCYTFPLLHLDKSSWENLRVQPLWLLWRRCAAGYRDEVEQITPSLCKQISYRKKMDRIQYPAKLCRFRYPH